jgi:hypothetical protein
MVKVVEIETWEAYAWLLGITELLDSCGGNILHENKQCGRRGMNTNTNCLA